jgi:hypothetical protein
MIAEKTAARGHRRAARRASKFDPRQSPRNGTTAARPRPGNKKNTTAPHGRSPSSQIGDAKPIGQHYTRCETAEVFNLNQPINTDHCNG